MSSRWTDRLRHTLGFRVALWYALLFVAGSVRVPGRGRPLELEVASLLLPDGTLLQVGKSTESRAELLERFRAVSLGVFGSIVAIALVGGALLTRAALQPVRDLIGVVQGLLRAGEMKARGPVRGQGDPPAGPGPPFHPKPRPHQTPI